jgi:exopolyphosphatase/guanosine-5'-triphosphate,3'-diphosphate pyrophosphatase
MKKKKNIAIIDIGSNTVRLVIYQLNEQMVFTELQNIKLPVRLYQFLDEENELTKTGVHQLLRVMNLFKEIAHSYALEEMIATATAVIRQSKNAQELLEVVEKKTGITIRLLSEKEEAYYGQYAIVCTTAFSEAYTVDMGGGSTEITYFKDNEIIYSHSFPFGVVTLKQLFFNEHSPNNENALEQTNSYLKKQFASLPWLKDRKIPIIAIGGSSRNIATVHERMTDFPVVGIHQYEMKKKDLKDTLTLFTSLSFSELQSLDGLSKERADIIIPANLTFIALMEQVHAPKFIFCNKGLREGLLMESVNQKYPATYSPHHVKMTSIQRFVDTYQIDNYRTKKRTQIVELLLNEIKQKQLMNDEIEQLTAYVSYGSQLYHIGSYIEEDNSAYHSFYLLANSNLNGFTHRERISLALLASYKNKSLFKLFVKPFKQWFTEEELKYIRLAGSLIKFCEALNITTVNEIIHFSLKDKETYFVLKVEWSFDPVAEEYRANRQKKNLENIINKKVVIDFKKA